MTRMQRAWHLWIWRFAAPLAIAAIVMTLKARHG